MTRDHSEALAWLDRCFARLHKKCDEYEIDRPEMDEATGWATLALRLAVEHEPGLNPFPVKVGAPPSSKTMVDDIVIFHALATAKSEGKPILQAARNLTKKGRFKGRSANSIRQRYYELLRPGSASDRLVLTIHNLAESCKDN